LGESARVQRVLRGPCARRARQDCARFLRRRFRPDRRPSDAHSRGHAMCERYGNALLLLAETIAEFDLSSCDASI